MFVPSKYNPGINHASSIYTQTQQEVQDIAYAIKEVNAVAGKPLFNAVLLCQPSQFTLIEKVWADSFSGVCEYVFIALKPQHKKGKHTIPGCYFGGGGEEGVGTFMN